MRIYSNKINADLFEQISKIIVINCLSLIKKFAYNFVSKLWKFKKIRCKMKQMENFNVQNQGFLNFNQDMT